MNTKGLKTGECVMKFQPQIPSKIFTTIYLPLGFITINQYI